MNHLVTTLQKPKAATPPITAVADCLVSRPWEGLRFELVDFADTHPGAGDGGTRLVADIYGVGPDDIQPWADELCAQAPAGMIHIHDFRGEHNTSDSYQPDISVVFEDMRSVSDLEEYAERYSAVKELPLVIKVALQDLHRREHRQKMVHLRHLSFAAA